MDLEIRSFVSEWHLFACCLTVLCLVVGFLYTCVWRTKDAMLIVSKSELQMTGGGNKWPIAGEKSACENAPDIRQETDPVEFCSHLQSQIKQTQHRMAQEKIMGKMTRQQQEEERQIQRRQLEDIFRLMEEQKEKFGIKEVGDVQEQLKMYVN